MFGYVFGLTAVVIDSRQNIWMNIWGCEVPEYNHLRCKYWTTELQKVDSEIDAYFSPVHEPEEENIQW